MPPIHYGPCPDAIVNAKAPLTRRGCDNTVCLRAWEQTMGSTHWGEQEPQGGPKMAKLDASKSGTFKIGGEIEINRLGFGAMRITGKGI
jgi:hypothetical protein